MKKIISILLAVVPTMLMLSSCAYYAKLFQEELPVLETEYFKYSVMTEDDGSQRAYVVGFTELGLEQTALVFPEEIDGIKVWGVGYLLPRWMGHRAYGRVQSEKLERLYFPFSYNETSWAQYNSSLRSTYLIEWYPQDEGAAYKNIPCKGAVYGYNLYKDKDKEGYKNSNCRIANISYLYNYENSPNEGWYWVDSYDEALITFIPPEPEREGYVFAGWYKEQDCLTPWDFEHDITGKELIIEAYGQNAYETYEGIYLYAKWVEN